MSLTVKAFLEKKGSTDKEIRRFPIPADVSSSYAYISKKIADIFPSLREDKFALFWKDPDGDLVAFSTDEEQMEALGFVTDSIFKVYIKINDNNQTESPEEDAVGEVHPGVVCDGCEGEVRGVRYKCLVCPDYDLCAACEKRSIHPDHMMMKFSSPQPFWGPQTPHPGPPRCGPHGHPRPGEPFAPPPHFRRWMKKFMKRWHNKNSPDCSHDDKDDSPEEGEATGEEDYLRSVGDSIATMLDPMGIDVHVDVEHGGKRQCRGRGRCHARGQFRRGRSWGPGQCLGREERLKRKEAKKQTEEVVEPEKKDDEVVVMEAENPAEVPMVAVDEAQLETEEITNGTEKIVITDDGDDDVIEIKEADRQPLLEPVRVDIQDNSWTLVTDVSPPPTQAVPAPPSPVQAPPAVPPQARAQTVQFNLPPQIVYPPSSPHVAQALQQMMSMGFNNDGGWLTRLLEAKNGDIIQVLDAIKPQPGRPQQGQSHPTSGGYMA